MDLLEQACLPAITTGALFIAIIFLDLTSRDWRRVPGHAIFGAFAVILMMFICQKASDGIAWTILAFPIVFIFLAYVFRLGYTPASSTVKYDNQEWEETVEVCPCPCCRRSPCSCVRPCWRPKWPAGCKPKTN